MKFIAATLALLGAAPAFAAVGEGGVLNTFADPKLKLLTGADVADIKNWDDARKACKKAGGRSLAAQCEWCSNKKKPTDQNTYNGIKKDSQWVPLRAKDKNEWLQIGTDPEADTCQTYRGANGIPYPKDAIAAAAGPYVSPCEKPKDCTADKCALTCTEKEGYYPSPKDCTEYCYCSGKDDGSSYWAKVKGDGEIWDPFCADSTALDRKNSPLGGTTGGCPNHDYYVSDKSYCGGKRRTLLRGENEHDEEHRRLQAVDELEIDWSPDWGLDTEKQGFEANEVLCSAIPKAPELPQTCGSLWGDPHFTTYDGLKYDCMGTGEFVAAKSLDSPLELQVGMERFSDDMQATVTRKAVFTTGNPDEPKVEMRFEDCKLKYFLDDVEMNLDQNWCADGSLATQTEKAAFFASRDDRYIYFPDSGISFHVRKKNSATMGCYMDVKVCLPDDVTQNEKLVGLFGTPDGNSDNDFNGPQGDDLEHNGDTEFQSAYDYCTNNWCVRDTSDSLFEPGSEMDPSTCEEPYDGSFEALVKDPPADLLKICGRELSCLIEGVAGGNAAAIDSVKTLKENGVEIIPVEKNEDRDLEDENESFEKNPDVSPAPANPDPAPGPEPPAPAPAPEEPEPVVCATDTKECWDGSFVSRSGDNCEFDECAPEPAPAPEPAEPEPVVCAQDTKECWDGSFVSRKGPKCKFAECKPEPQQPSTPGGFGDPHIKKWGGELFDFHGACDLVLLDNPAFHDGLGMSIHIRTEIRSWWSLIKRAALRIGDDVFEIQGGHDDDHKVWINGKEIDTHDAEGLTFSQLNLKVGIEDHADGSGLRIRVDLLNADAIGFGTFKDFVRVNVRETDPKWKKFAGAVGLMGAHPNGELLGRDGMTAFTDRNAFGMEWQVKDTERKIFSTVEGVQHPTKCVMPNEISQEEKRRRLGASMITMEDAEIACARVAAEDRDACIFDVLATNDSDMAGSY